MNSLHQNWIRYSRDISVDIDTVHQPVDESDLELMRKIGSVIDRHFDRSEKGKAE